MTSITFTFDNYKFTKQNKNNIADMKNQKFKFIGIVLFAFVLSSCGIFKKNCNCPDIRKSKGVAQKEQKMENS